MPNIFAQRQQELDHRESQLNAQSAQLESDARTARIWLGEREAEIQDRDAQRTALEAEVRQRFDRLAAAEAALEQRSKQQAGDGPAENGYRAGAFGNFRRNGASNRNSFPSNPPSSGEAIRRSSIERNHGSKSAKRKWP